MRIIEEENFNDNLQWLYYEVFNRYLKKEIGKDIKDEKNLNNIINNIMDINIESFTHDNLEILKKDNKEKIESDDSDISIK